MIGNVDRRRLLAGASALIAAGAFKSAPSIAFGTDLSTAGGIVKVEPAPLGTVKLKPSIFADAIAANRRYLASLDPERLLHNFYLSAGLDAPQPIYGGWESLGLAGHSLGHWLSAVSTVLASGPDAELATKLDHCLAEMERIQSAHGDGYCGGTTVERDGKIVDGKIIFEEVRRGEISSNGFDLNGGWVPLYTWHKIHAGLIDAQRLARNPRALPILLGVAGYLASVLEGLDEGQLQRVLAAEHGGLNESYADTYALTGDRRWLRMAQAIRHRAVLDPLAAGMDRLAGLHANTQIPKVIGLARLHEIPGREEDARAARFLHHTVRDHHSYVIGGNSEREHFGEPDRRAGRITEATCEACNSYNMLKLTRHLYQWQPDAALFDYYERVQFNHIMAHQRPSDGRFVYFMPLSAGARRIYSEAEDSFWCCVGSGMESHAKHADSIFWADGRSLFVNLYIPSTLDWPDRRFQLSLETAMPFSGTATLSIGRAPRRSHAFALRIPVWARGARFTVNGKETDPDLRHGYAVIERRWRKGDTIGIDLPMALAVETVPDDPSLVAFVHGPLVLAADLGPADDDFAGLGPALVIDGDPAQMLKLNASDQPQYSAQVATGEGLQLHPFFNLYDRRSAVYFPTFTASAWAANKERYLSAQEADRLLARRTVDVVHLGEMQPERDHGFTSGRSEVVNWNGLPARRLPPGETMEMTLARKAGPSVLRVTVWSGDAAGRFALEVDGKQVGMAWPVVAAAQEGFVALDFPLPAANEQGQDKAVVRITALKEQALVYALRMLTGD